MLGEQDSNGKGTHKNYCLTGGGHPGSGITHLAVKA